MNSGKSTRDGRGRVFFLRGGPGPGQGKGQNLRVGAGQGKGQNLWGGAGQNVSLSADLDHLLKEGNLDLNIEDWVESYWDANNEKVEQAKSLMAASDQCCFCEFNCPPPSQHEDENRFNGVLDSLWDHIEMNHHLEWEWLA